MREEIPWPCSRLYDRYVNRAFVKWFKQITKDIKARQILGIILDIGTGPGRLPIEIAKQVTYVKVVGIDLSKDMVRIAKKNAEEEGVAERVKFNLGSAYNTGFKDCSIDLAISTGLIHHLKEPIRAFKEIYRILKWGGEAWMYDGRRDATRAEIEESVKSLGMEEELPLPLWFVKRIWPYLHIGYNTDVYLSGKVGKALKESMFKVYYVEKEGAYIKIMLRKN